MHIRFCVLILFFCFTLVPSGVALAQVNIVQVQKLQFGKWFFADNSSPATITVTPTGVVSSNNSSITMLTQPTFGIYNITGLPAFATITGVNVTVGTPLQIGGDSFTLNNFTTSIPDADGLGNTQLRLGADLVTTGNSQPYAANVYNGDISIEIVY